MRSAEVGGCANMRQPPAISVCLVSNILLDRDTSPTAPMIVWTLPTYFTRLVTPEQNLASNLKMDKRLGKDKVGWLFDVARWSKPFLVAGSILLIFSTLTRSTALAQVSFNSTTHDTALPDAPQPTQVTSSSGANDSPQTGTGIITGTVLDRKRDVLQGARVTLAGSSG